MRKDNKVKEDNTGNYLIGMSFLLPVVLMLVIYKTVGIYPFGEKTVLTVDLSHQYVSYFAYFKEILKGNHSLFYSFSKTLGGDLVGLTGYYLMSPLNIILLFFPDTMLPVAIEIISLIKTGLCGLTFYLFLTREKKVLVL